MPASSQQRRRHLSNFSGSLTDVLASAERISVIDRETMHRICERHIDAIAVDHLNILEAGCGRYWRLDVGSRSYRIVGVDLDGEAMRTRVENFADLHEAIVGDIATVRLPENAFDVIHCSFLLEHIESVRPVLVNFVRWLRPGGKILITIPDRSSVHGFFTRMTPHWFHILYKRYFSPLGKNSGKPGFGPYRTYYDPLLGDAQLRSFIESMGMHIAEVVGFVVDPPPAWLRIFKKFIWTLSCGRLSWRHDDLLYVIVSSPESVAARE